MHRKGRHRPDCRSNGHVAQVMPLVKFPTEQNCGRCCHLVEPAAEGGGERLCVWSQSCDLLIFSNLKAGL